MNHRRALVGLLGAALLGVVPVGLAAPAQAAPSTIEARISTDRARFNQSFTISGATTCNGAGAPGSVTVHRRFKGTTRWTRLGSDSAAGFSFALRAKGNADYALVYAGSGSCEQASIGGPQKVFRRIPIRINDRLVYSGTVKPAWKRKPVTIQVKRNGRWVKLDRVRTNRRSHWSKKVYARRGTRTHFRAVVRRTTRFQKTVARSVVTYYVRGRVGVQQPTQQPTRQRQSLSGQSWG